MLLSYISLTLFSFKTYLSLCMALFLTVLQNMKKLFYIMVGTGCQSGLKRVACLMSPKRVNTLGEGKLLCKRDWYVVCMQCEMWYIVCLPNFCSTLGASLFFLRVVFQNNMSLVGGKKKTWTLLSTEDLHVKCWDFLIKQRVESVSNAKIVCSANYFCVFVNGRIEFETFNAKPLNWCNTSTIPAFVCSVFQRNAYVTLPNVYTGNALGPFEPIYH